MAIEARPISVAVWATSNQFSQLPIQQNEFLGISEMAKNGKKKHERFRPINARVRAAKSARKWHERFTCCTLKREQAIVILFSLFNDLP